MYKKIIWGGVGIVILSLIIFGLIRNGKSPINIEDGKLQIVSTLFPMYDFAKAIGKDKVVVTLLLPPGVESHSFEPKPSDIVKINEADIFVYTGKYMETWAEDIIKGITNKNIKIVDVSNGIELIKEIVEEEHEHEEGVHHHGGVDPHIWLDFDNAQIMVDNIANTMIEKDPDNADYYKRNAAEYKNKLSLLDNNYKEKLSNCLSREIVYGGHYTFGYLAKSYDLAYTAAQGFSPDSEPTANDLAELVQQIKKDDVKYIFYEELSSPKIAETLSQETGTKILLLNGAHNLTKEDYENSTSYISLMENNLQNLSLGLGCVK